MEKELREPSESLTVLTENWCVEGSKTPAGIFTRLQKSILSPRISKSIKESHKNWHNHGKDYQSPISIIELIWKSPSGSSEEQFLYLQQPNRKNGGKRRKRMNFTVSIESGWIDIRRMAIRRTFKAGGFDRCFCLQNESITC